MGKSATDDRNLGTDRRSVAFQLNNIPIDQLSRKNIGKKFASPFPLIDVIIIFEDIVVPYFRRVGRHLVINFENSRPQYRFDAFSNRLPLTTMAATADSSANLTFRKNWGREAECVDI